MEYSGRVQTPLVLCCIDELYVSKILLIMVHVVLELILLCVTRIPTPRFFEFFRLLRRYN